MDTFFDDIYEASALVPVDRVTCVRAGERRASQEHPGEPSRERAATILTEGEPLTGVMPAPDLDADAAIRLDVGGLRRSASASQNST